MKLNLTKQGYSLIELTIVVGLISILSLTISAVVLGTITNSTRIRNKVRIRQTGDYAVGQIKTMVRSSLEVVTCDSANNTLLLRNQDSATTQIFLEGDQIASNSGVHLTPDDISVTNYDLVCLPSDEAPDLIQIGFQAGKADTQGLRSTENVIEQFNLSTSIRNE